MPLSNMKVVLAQRPDGYPRAADFREVSENLPELKNHDVLLKNLYISLTPGDRLFMNRAIDLGTVMRAHTLSQVVDANGCKAFSAGTLVVTKGGWQEYAILTEDDLRPVIDYDPITVNLSVLDAQGLTAYFGLLDVAKPSPGTTLLISGASGTVGSIVGQIAKLHGCEVIGVCGANEVKQRWLLDELGFDEVVEETCLLDALFAALPDGVDVFFDNVGGEVLDAALKLIAKNGAEHARVVCCGMVSQYNRPRDEEAYGVKGLHALVNRRIRMEGFIVGDYRDRYPEALDVLQTWLTDGHIKVKEDITVGLEDAPTAFIRMMTRQTFGKTLVRL